MNNIKVKLTDTLDFVKKHYWPLLILSFPIVFTFEVLKIILYKIDMSSSISYFSFINILLYFLYSGVFVSVIVFSVDKLYNNIPFGFTELRTFLFRNFLILALSSFIIGILVRIGFILLVLPGIYILGRLAIAPFLIGLDKSKLLNSFYISFEFSKKDTWAIFLCLFVISIPAAILHFAQDFLVTQIMVSIFSLIIYLNYVVESVLIYLFYIEIKANMVEVHNIQKVS